MASLKKTSLTEALNQGTTLATARKKVTFGKVAVAKPSKKAVTKEVQPVDIAVLLKNIPASIVKKAWFITSHLLLDPHARVVDAGCGDGAMTYAMAALKPEIEFIGLDIKAEKIEAAREKYRLNNLSYQLGNIYTDLGESSYDGIINSFSLHEIYSDSYFNDRLIELALQRQYKALKDRGVMIVRDYLNPDLQNFVQMEFSEGGPASEDFETCSEADLLVWFSEHARETGLQDKNSGGGGDSGFFLEELPPNFPRMRLFRLPEKWAYEFIWRKDDRALLKAELHKEYAFYDELDFGRLFSAMGARLTYSAPHWDEAFLKARYNGKIRLYDENGQRLGPPPANHMMVVHKLAERVPQMVQERRASRQKDGPIHINTVRNDKNGTISDVISRDLEISEIIPFRVSAEGRLKIYLQDSVPRGLANAVPRHGKILDGRKWSGHMIEAMAISSDIVLQVKDKPYADLQKFAQNYLGFKPSMDARLLEGGGFYPDPNRIDERILTHYFRVETLHPAFAALHPMVDVEGYSSRPIVHEYDAQDILNAIAVGYIPTSRLETQILALFQLLGIKAEAWGDMPLQLSELPVDETLKITDIMKQYSLSDDRYKPARGQAGQVRMIQSVFVEEGREANGNISGLSARDMQFAVEEDHTINTAVVLPLVKNLNGEVMAGVVTQYLPVPQRYSGTGHSVTLPSFNLPKDVTDIEAAKHYIAKQYDVKPEYVARMGESYFTHIGITPHRIYPFVVTNFNPGSGGHVHGTTSVTMLRDLWKLLYWDNGDSFIKVVSMAYQNLMDSDMSVRRSFDFSMEQQAQQSTIFNSDLLSSPASGYSTASGYVSESSASSSVYDGVEAMGMYGGGEGNHYQGGADEGDSGDSGGNHGSETGITFDGAGQTPDVPKPPKIPRLAAQRLAANSPTRVPR